VGQAIGEALEVNQTLTHIDLGHNRICGQAAVTLAKALMNNHILKSIVLSHNPFTTAEATALVSAVCANDRPIHVELERLIVDWSQVQGVPNWYVLRDYV